MAPATANRLFREARVSPAAEMSGVAALLDAIKASKEQDVDERIQLVNLLGETDTYKKPDFAVVAENLIMFWEDHSCSGISQCKLNKAILHVAMKCIEKDSHECNGSFLMLATKANIWCRQHMEVDEFHDDNHLALFYGLITASLSFSSALYSVLTRSSIPEEKRMLVNIEDFVMEHLNLTNTAIFEFKKIGSVASEIMKAAQVALDSAIKFCSASSELIKCDSCKMSLEDDQCSESNGEVHYLTHFVKIGTCVLENLRSLGILASSGGGSLVTILNTSWKGVVSLLQLANGILSKAVNIGDIIQILISLARTSLRCAADAWFSTGGKTVEAADAKRAFLPIKFYLINSVRISSQYASRAFQVYEEISSIVLLIFTFSTLSSKETYLKAVSNASAELLEPTSFHLLLSLLNASEIDFESKIKILDWLFGDFSEKSIVLAEKHTSIADHKTSFEEIFAVECDAVSRALTFQLGRVVLFLNLMKSSPYLKDDVIHGISKKLEYLLNILVDENVYSVVLVLFIPMLHGNGSMTELVCRPIFPSILHALKTFLIVSSRNEAWKVVESFLLENFIHPHFLCWEIVMELWCFLLRHADAQTITTFVNRICSFFKDIAASEPSLLPSSALRKVSCSICTILNSGVQCLVDQIYTSIFTDDMRHFSNILFTALLVEGFPLDILSDNLKKDAMQKTLSSLCSTMENIVREVKDRNFCETRLPGLPLYALLPMLQSIQLITNDLDTSCISRILKLAGEIIQGYRSSTDMLEKDLYCKLLSQVLEIVSATKHLYTNEEMSEALLQLYPLFVKEMTASNACLFQCQPSLASFMANLDHLKIIEGEDCTTSTAIWELFHFLLRNRHWAFIHLALAAFGYFAARTSCHQLWRFVPPDAALSFDVETGKEPGEDRFMYELKRFLERDAALVEATPCCYEFAALVTEGKILKKIVEETARINLDASVCNPMETENLNSGVKNKKRKVKDHINLEDAPGDRARNAADRNWGKKRKCPDELIEGIALLHRGVKAVDAGLAHWGQQLDVLPDMQHELSSQLGCIVDIVSRLESMVDERCAA